MKITRQQSGSVRSVRGTTLVEMMASLAIFVLLIAAYMTSYVFILRQDELVSSVLGANDASRVNFNQLIDEIRSSKNIQVGTGLYTNFVPITNGLQQGTAIQLITSTNSGVNIYYWFDTNSAALYRAAFTNNIQLESNMVTQFLTNMTSQWLTNAMIFQAYDYTGTNLLTMDPTNYNYNYSISVLLQFAQYQYPQTMLGTNYLYSYYQLTYSATRRSP